MEHCTLTYTLDELARQQCIKLKNSFNNIDWILKLCKGFNNKTIGTSIFLKYYFINSFKTNVSIMCYGVNTIGDSTYEHNIIDNIL